MQHYGNIAKPLTELLKKNQFQWHDAATQAFQKLKEAMSHPPVLALPDFIETFIVETDASSNGMGAVLVQKKRPTAFFSKALSTSHQALSVYEKEMLAVVTAIQKWRAYLIGRHFIIKTDHQSIKYLMDQRIHTPLQQKWIAKLLGYDYEVQYKKGSDNIVADALSRRPHTDGHLCSLVTFTSPLITDIQGSWQNDVQLQGIIQDLTTGQHSHKNYTWQHGSLKRKGKLVAGNDSQLRSRLIELWHSSTQGGHSGIEVTYRRLKSVLCWKNMFKDVADFVAACDVCRRVKADNSAYPGLLHPLPIPQKVWTDISMDFIEGLPKSHGKDVILVVVDRLSKYAHFIALSHPYSAISVAQLFLDQIYRLHGMPQTIVNDRDATFLSQFWQELFKLQQVQLHMSTSYHPQSDGQTEVVNRCLENYLRCMAMDQPKQWSLWIPSAEYWYNTNFHSATKFTPYEVVYGQQPPTHVPYLPEAAMVESVDRSLRAREKVIHPLRHNLTKAQHRMKQLADKHRSERQFNVGDWAYVKLQPYRQHSLRTHHCQKLSSRYFGPFLVEAKVGPVAYKLRLPASVRIHSTFHVSALKRKIGSASVQPHIPAGVTDQGHLMMEPLAILDRRVVKRGRTAATQVLVQWSNCFPEDSTWEFLQDLQRQFPNFSP